jgi:hypothetical protein
MSVFFLLFLKTINWQVLSWFLFANYCSRDRSLCIQTWMMSCFCRHTALLWVGWPLREVLATVHNDSCWAYSSCWVYSNPSFTYRFIVLVTALLDLILYYIHWRIYSLGNCIKRLVTKLGIWAMWYGFCSFLGTVVKLRKATISFVKSVRPSAWNNSAPTGQIFMKFDIWVFFEDLLRKFKFH